MKKILVLTFFISMIFLSCKKEVEKVNESEEILDISEDFNNMLNNYYEEGLVLDPIKATFAGDNRFNQSFPNYLSNAYKDSSIAYYKKFKKRLQTFKEKDLSDIEKMSKAVLLWDCNINLEGLKYRKELIPMDQMWSRNLLMGQLASGASAQPFNTVEDYNNWLTRLEGYTQWLKTAEERMKEGVKIRYVLPNALIVKVIPQLKTLADPSIEDHLFFSPINNFPKYFTKEEKPYLPQHTLKF